MKKIFLVYDYQTPYGFFHNAQNLGFISYYQKIEFIENQIDYGEINKKYQDGISTWKGDNVFHEITDSISISDVNQNDSDHIFLYNLSPYGGASCAYGFEWTTNQGFSFFEFISKTALDKIIKQKNFFLLINYSNEGTVDTRHFKVIHEELIRFNIPENKLIFCISDYNIDKNYDKWFGNSEYKNKIKTLYSNWSLTQKSLEFNDIITQKNTSFKSFQNTCSVVLRKDINFEKIRPFKFLMFNRRLRPHRIFSILEFYKRGILEEFLISYDFKKMQTFFLDYGNIKNHFENKNIKELLNLYHKLYNSEPKRTIDYDDLENVWGFNFETKTPYLNTYIHIVSETNFFEDGGYFSEKTWKPIGHLQPFIFLGSYGSLKQLKNLGFKTFSPFINESYDDEENNEKRFTMIIEEIDRISKIDTKIIHEWYKTIFDSTLLHNQKLFLEISKTQKIDKILEKEILKITSN